MNMKKHYLVPQMEVYDFRGDPMMQEPTYIWPASTGEGGDQNQFMTSSRVIGTSSFWK